MILATTGPISGSCFPRTSESFRAILGSIFLMISSFSRLSERMLWRLR